MAHCQRESMHAQWAVLLDDEFIDAYWHGQVIACSDGVTRRAFPRIFTYSADYPEKYVKVYLMCVFEPQICSLRVLLASIRNRGGCPCPRCLIPIHQISNVGKKADMLQRTSTLARVDNEQRTFLVQKARQLIYNQNNTVDCVAVEKLLKDKSLVPTLVSVIEFLFH